MDISQASSLWLDSLYCKPSTKRLYAISMRQLVAWATVKRLELDKITALHLSKFIGSLENLSQNTVHARIKTYKAFFRFCDEHKLVAVSPARHLKAPRYLPPDKRPYTQAERIAILQAAQTDGKLTSDRLMAKAALLVMHRHGLRISDVAALRRDAFYPDGFLRLKTIKTGAQIEHPTVPVVMQALECLPWEGAYYFHDDKRNPAYALHDLSVLLREVYRLSGVKGAQNHRWRHSLAAEILSLKGRNMQDVAQFLGISEQIAAKHYAKMSPGRQARINSLMVELQSREAGNDLPVS